MPGDDELRVDSPLPLPDLADRDPEPGDLRVDLDELLGAGVLRGEHDGRSVAARKRELPLRPAGDDRAVGGDEPRGPEEQLLDERRPIHQARLDGGRVFADAGRKNLPLVKSIKPRVLVIDDSPTCREAVIRALRPEFDARAVDCFVGVGYEIAEHPPALILLDLAMPGFNGIEMAKFLRSRRKCFAPILLYTERPAAEAERAARAIKAAGVVPKSTSPDLLRARVRLELRHGGGAESARLASWPKTAG